MKSPGERKGELGAYGTCTLGFKPPDEERKREREREGEKRHVLR